jgi:hypothetical protein
VGVRPRRTAMRFACAIVALLALAACGAEQGDRAADPAGDPAASGPPATTPTAIPAARGPVTTRNPATVMDTGSPELCLGAVAESYPPQCRGIPLAGWSWRDHDGAFERAGDVRWGLFAVTGTFDGTTLIVRDAVPAAVYDPAPLPPEPTPCEDLAVADCHGPTEQRIAEIGEELTELPGMLTIVPSRFTVRADVVHDDGSLQAWADETYGDGVVVIASALEPLTR